MGLIMVAVAVEDLPVRPTLIWADVPLFDILDGLRLVEYCEDNNIAILGVEGFRVKGDKRVPDMDYIVDFSASLNEEGFAKKSAEVVRGGINSTEDRAVLLEFVLVKV